VWRCAGTEEEAIENVGTGGRGNVGVSQGDVECEKDKQNGIYMKYEERDI
jgi:hypothetical protein